MTEQFDLFPDTDFVFETPFHDRVVCLLGSFTPSTRVLQQKLKEMGADFKSSVRPSRNVHYVLVGKDAPPDALEQLPILAFHGYQPKVLTQRDLDELLSGHYSPYWMPKEIQKNLHLSYEHYASSHVDYSQPNNPLYTHELYLAPDLQTPWQMLYQMLGDKGVYANSYIDDLTDIIVISDSSFERLKCGESDEVLHYIEEMYNKSHSLVYKYVLTTESELLSFLSK